jgi:hypothetical protein
MSDVDETGTAARPEAAGAPDDLVVDLRLDPTSQVPPRVGRLPIDPPRGHEGSFVHRNGLALACFGFFFLFWAAQSVTGWHVYNEEAATHGQSAVSYGSYLVTGHFLEATFENWESEFLQMFAFVLLTAWLVQRGSAESRGVGDDPADADPAAHRTDPDAPWPVRRGGLWSKLYENSLLIAFVALFALSIVGHALGGAAEYSEELQAHGEPAASVAEFVASSDFWFQSFQNWQSEFLAVGSIVVLTIFLRQKGSPESKPVHAPNWQTDGS